MEKPDIYFVITKNCDLRCRHCYLEAGPDNLDTTISADGFKSVIDHLPKVSLELTLTGGEVFTIKDTLFSYLEYIKSRNIERLSKRQGRIEVILQTNASWAENYKKIKSTLNDLVDLDVKALDITSNDKYHREWGIKRKNLNLLKKKAEESGLLSVSLRGASNRSVMPIGRAKGRNLKNCYIDYDYCENSLDRYDISIREDGKVYLCCFSFFELPGNVIEKPLVEIVRQAKKDERLMIMNNEGLESLAVHDGWKERDVEDLIAGYGKCGFCYEFYQS